MYGGGWVGGWSEHELCDSGDADGECGGECDEHGERERGWGSDVSGDDGAVCAVGDDGGEPTAVDDHEDGECGELCGGDGGELHAGGAEHGDVGDDGGVDGDGHDSDGLDDWDVAGGL